MIEECLAVEFRVTGDDCPLAEATRATGGHIDGQPPLLRADGYALLHFSSATDGVGEWLDDDDRVRYLHEAGGGSRSEYRCLSKQLCVVHELIDVGLLVDSVHYTDGSERHVGAVVGHEELQMVLKAAGDAVGVSLERLSPLRVGNDASIAERWNLTPAQGEAIEAALELNYFAVPREATAEEVAEALGISKSAFHERLRRAQASLFERIYG